MNKLLTALCLSSAVLACSPLQAAWQGNWLVGASGGYTHSRGELNVTFLDFLGGQAVVTPRFKDDGWFLGLLGGYQIRCNGWILGEELNFDWYDISTGGDDHWGSSNDNFAYTDSSDFGWAAHSRFKREWVAGLTTRLGYDICTWLTPYIRGGFEWSKDKLHYRQRRSDDALVIGADGSRNSIRVLAGFGVEMPIPGYNCITVRGEYDFHAKGRIVAANNFVSNNTLNATRQPNYHTVFASVVWNI